MSRRGILALFCSFCLAADPAHAGYRNGAEYLGMGEAERTGYVMGLFDMLEVIALSDSPHRVFHDRIKRCTADMSIDQLRAFIDDYLRSDPTFARYSMASNFSAAFNRRCPK